MATKPNSELATTRYFWFRLALLGAGLGALTVTHRVAGQLDDSLLSERSTWTAALVAITLSLALVTRSVHVIVTSANSDAHRVFRSRHLAACAAVLLGTGIVTVVLLVVHDPFDRLVAHGRITAVDLVDLSVAVAAVVCSVGAGVALAGAWDAARAERNWHHTLHLHSRRRI